jgi:hypothetical protein
MKHLATVSEEDVTDALHANDSEHSSKLDNVKNYGEISGQGNVGTVINGDSDLEDFVWEDMLRLWCAGLWQYDIG